MAGTNIGDENIETDCTANNQIKSLNLAQNSSIHNAFLTSPASTFPNLEVLDLSGCKGVTEGGFVQVLKRCSEIRELMTDGRVRKNLCLLLEFELPKLKVLSWMYSIIDDEALAMIRKRCPSLQILNLAGRGSLTSEGMKGAVKNCKKLREMLHEYATKVKLMMGIVFQAMAKSLNLEDNSFAKQLFGDQSLMQARFNFFPPCSRSDLVLGVKPHTDRSGVTCLLQDKDVEGLQVLIDGKWVRVPIVPHAIVLNLGDQMQIMSNGIYKSPMHRVVTNGEIMRLSVALFNEPDPETEIGPVEELIDETRPRLYKNVKNYGRINYECYQRGEIALETVRF